MFYKEVPEGIILYVRAQPGAGRDEIVGKWGGRTSPIDSGKATPVENSIKIRVTAPPEKGKANEAIIKLLAKKLGLKKSAFQIISGETSQNKKILIHGVNKSQIKPYLDSLHQKA